MAWVVGVGRVLDDDNDDDDLACRAALVLGTRVPLLDLDGACAEHLRLVGSAPEGLLVRGAVSLEVPTRPIMRCPPCRLLAALALCPWAVGAVEPAVDPEGPLAGVIGFDLRGLDADGLVGPPGGKVALDYEFCVPVGAGFTAEVQAIDDSARFHPGVPGRIGCGPEQVLVLGNTHRPDFAFVLQRLADLPYVERIERAWLE